MAERQRLTWIDWCKCIAIFLVILGHLPLQEEFGHFIYLWHMPLFFMISGYLYKRSPLQDELKKCFYSILLPYLIYNTFYLLPLPHGGEFKPKYIVDVLIGNQEELCFLMRSLWFLVSLLVMRIICSIIQLKNYLFLNPSNVGSSLFVFEHMNVNILCPRVSLIPDNLGKRSKEKPSA